MFNFVVFATVVTAIYLGTTKDTPHMTFGILIGLVSLVWGITLLCLNAG